MAGALRSKIYGDAIEDHIALMKMFFLPAGSESPLFFPY